ncbi:MAG: hypothetical protein KJ856_16495 [Gammaproteobacteria bacterium]|nr:hypothetical protein [Gammaproteobacteria bacterium]QYX64947.1 hypothetical protein K2227_00950 [Shewanella putrefaciens]MBU1479186.1 hypothetical protein [Gammaproteobacteria bacterium]MBU2002387.1 hypothetical protein [Gammaproteobacteria bacterium]MBU2133281.1 hypothetical protein [Gammaproteobacteria bacterium]
MGKGCYASALVLLLGGCGGSGDSSGGDSGDSGTTPARLVMDVQSVASKCNVKEKMAGADVIIHRQDGHILGTHKSDGQGHVDIPWTSEASHLTVAAKEFRNGQSTWSIRTDLAAKAGDYGIYAFTDENLNSQCDCSDVNFDLSEIEAVYSDYQLYGNNSFLDSHSNNSSLRLCKQDDKFAPVNMVLVPSQSGVTAYAASIDINTLDLSQAVPISSSEFEGTHHEGTPLNVDVNTNDYSLRSYSETEFGRQNWVEWPTKEVQLFPAIFDRNVVYASQWIALGANEAGYINYSAITRRAVTDPSKSLSLNLPLNENQMLDETTRLITTINNGGSANYDYSFNNAHMQAMQITIGQDGYANWAISASLKGSIPDLDLPIHLQTAFDGITIPMMSLYVWGYEGMTGLYDFRAELSKSSRSTGNIRSAKFDNYNYEAITIFAN